MQNDDGETPLHFASEDGEKEVYALLVEKGADRNMANNDGYTLEIVYKVTGYRVAL